MKKNECKIEKCNLMVHARQLCKKHYEQARKAGEFDDAFGATNEPIRPFGWSDENRPAWHNKAK